MRARPRALWFVTFFVEHCCSLLQLKSTFKNLQNINSPAQYNKLLLIQHPHLPIGAILTICEEGI